VRAFLRLGLAGLLAIGPALAMPADGPLPAAPNPPDTTMSADLVKTGLYLISGGGSNSLLRLSAIGSILVDGKQPGSYRALMSQVRRISKLSDLPTRVLVITDHHDHHTGNHAQFIAAGIAVLAHDNAKGHLPATPADAASGAKKPGPVVTFEREYTLRMGGVEMRLFHFGNAHTGDDTVVQFPDLKVVAIGDLFTPDTPVPDLAGGGSLAGWGPVLERVLQLDFDIAVPSVGPMVTRADLIAFKTKIDVLVSRATALVNAGVEPDRFLARLETGDLGWKVSYTPEQVARLYADLSRDR
jgi:cyclase